MSVHVAVFQPNYIDDAPRGNTSYATLIPFRETDLIKWHHEHRIHGTLIDRTRLPKYAADGLALAQSGTEMDEADNMPQVTDWIRKFRERALVS